MPALRELVVSRLKDAGVRMIFGVPGGGGNLDLIEAAGQADLPFVLSATETGGALAALAQAEVTGRPGACLTTLGPGAASVANGVACALLDSVPLLVVTDSHAAAANGAFEHQQFDHRAFFRPITKWSGRLSAECADRTLDQAFVSLLDPPPGPVHIDWPADFEATPGRSSPEPRVPSPESQVSSPESRASSPERRDRVVHRRERGRPGPRAGNRQRVPGAVPDRGENRQIELLPHARGRAGINQLPTTKCQSQNSMWELAVGGWKL